MNESLQLMLSLQDGVNSVIDADWRERGNAWHRAVWMECAEMLEREGDWKWWKAAPQFSSDEQRRVHLEQQQIELCDIWHFILSWALEDRTPVDDLDAWMRHSVAAGTRHELIEQMVAHAVNRELSQLVAGFAAACEEFQLGREQLYAMYVGKNVVNRFRQDRGYKTGSYDKVFAGKEDNEHLAEILNELDDAAVSDLPDMLYERLAERYDASRSPSV